MVAGMILPEYSTIFNLEYLKRRYPLPPPPPLWVSLEGNHTMLITLGETACSVSTAKKAWALFIK